jgi:hypothetical protein
MDCVKKFNKKSENKSTILSQENDSQSNSEFDSEID